MEEAIIFSFNFIPHQFFVRARFKEFQVHIGGFKTTSNDSWSYINPGLMVFFLEVHEARSACAGGVGSWTWHVLRDLLYLDLAPSGSTCAQMILRLITLVLIIYDIRPPVSLEFGGLCDRASLVCDVPWSCICMITNKLWDALSTYANRAAVRVALSLLVGD
jgi:hypothetical protein